MNVKAIQPPLGLYVHIPWCVRKCPYCDFNSHQHMPSQQAPNPPFDAYRDALLADLESEAKWAKGRKLQSIFFGGGTPSLFPTAAIADIINTADKLIGIADHAEITLEANPGASEYTSFRELRQAGVNRLSFGVQSFSDKQLKLLGRIHSAKEAMQAYDAARAAGFDNINLDLMHGLPQQDIASSNYDLLTAIKLQPEHISWYQLTIEANTVFYSSPPRLPKEATLLEIYEQGQSHIQAAGFEQYEVSAYAQSKRTSQHNTLYWQFGDYLGIGAGAHGKVSYDQSILRYQKSRLPDDYLKSKNVDLQGWRRGANEIRIDQLPIEFMMNALRLKKGVASSLFTERTGLSLQNIQQQCEQLRQKKLLVDDDARICTTDLGFRHLNSVLGYF